MFLGSNRDPRNVTEFYGVFRRFLTASRVHQLGAFLVVRSLFVGVFLGVRSGFMGRDPREFAGSSRGPASGRRAWFLGGLSRARVHEAK